MKTELFKKLIKQAVKEAIQEELKEILLEAVRVPKTNELYNPVKTQTIKENIILSSNPKDQQSVSQVDRRQAYMDIVGDMKNKFGKGEINMTTDSLVVRSMDTTSEGSALPSGEVSLDQIMKISGKR